MICNIYVNKWLSILVFGYYDYICNVIKCRGMRIKFERNLFGYFKCIYCDLKLLLEEIDFCCILEFLIYYNGYF